MYAPLASDGAGSQGVSVVQAGDKWAGEMIFIPPILPFLFRPRPSPPRASGGSISTSSFASSLHVGDRVMIGTGAHWIWRNGTKHWAVIERIHSIETGGSPWIRFYVRWEHRKFGIFPSRDWVEYFDIDGVERRQPC